MPKRGPPKPFDYQCARKPWSFMERFWIGLKGDLYMNRLSIIQTPWFSIKLHKIHRPDRQRDLHNHPWSFLSVILLGHYVEDTVRGLRPCRVLNWKPANGSAGRHSIRRVSRNPVWTLVFCGPKVQSWGFWVDGGKRFVNWKEYDRLYGA